MGVQNFGEVGISGCPELGSSYIPGYQKTDLPLAVRPEYRETGLEEQIVRALVDDLMETIPRPTEAVIYVGTARAPVLLSTLRGLDLTDESFR